MSRVLLLIAITMFVLLYILFQGWHISPIIWFTMTGLSIGIYYGWFNNDIFHQSGKFNNEFEKVHALYIHVVCSLAGSASLFILFNKFPFISVEFSTGDFLLLIFGILGIVGLLPRMFWFLANSGDLIKKLFN